MQTSLKENTDKFDSLLRINESFDVVRRDIVVCEKKCAFYFIDGLIKDETMQKVLDVFMKLDKFAPSSFGDLKNFYDTYIAYVEVEECNNDDKIVTGVLSGIAAMFVDGLQGAVMIDARTYPARSVTEPENDKILRGPRVGFVETLVFNTALIRRHIRDTELTMEIKTVGFASKTDVVLCYMENRVDRVYLKRLRELIEGIKADALTLSSESLAESLIKRRWYNPFPKIRYTERPDTVAAHVLEGKIAVICDNSPSVMILPTSIFDFLQEADDFYLPPLTGTYLRFIRCLIFLLTPFLTPVWYLVVSNPESIPSWLDFIKVAENPGLPIIVQLIILEFAIDGLKLAALNTPSMLSGSFSIIGGLILGDYAVKVGWFVPETILYMAFVAIANFAQPSYELGYAFKFLRIIILVLTAIFGVWGFVGGIILFFALLLSNKTVGGGRRYLYPLVPFDGKAMFRAFIRKRL